MTDAVYAYTQDKAFDEEGQDLIELYNVLVKDLTSRLNPLKYALITINVSRQFSSNWLGVTNKYRFGRRNKIPGGGKNKASREARCGDALQDRLSGEEIELGSAPWLLRDAQWG